MTVETLEKLISQISLKDLGQEIITDLVGPVSPFDKEVMEGPIVLRKRIRLKGFQENEEDNLVERIVAT